MAAPTSLLQGARAFARDFARDQMPRGYLWDVVDYVPTFIDAALTGRGGWRWGSDVLSGKITTGILASYTAGDQLLFQSDNGRLLQVNPESPYNTIADRGAVYTAIQNPVQRLDDVVHFEWGGTVAPQLIRSGSIVTAPAPAPKANVGCVWGSYLVTGGGQGETDTVRFSHPTNDLATAGGWDAASSQRTSGKVTGLAALRSVILVFHAGSTERIRGSTPPNTAAPTNDDLNLEPLFSRTGCPEPKTIAYWNENVVFADEHGVHLTDGAVVRNLVSQGGILSYWRNLWQTRTYAASCAFLDYYIITLGGTPPTTLVVDLNKRQWFRFSNMPVQAYVSSGGSKGMERIWGGLSTQNRAIRVGPIFFPSPSGQNNDDDGTPVLPAFETPWYRMGEEGRKRVRSVYLSYDVRSSGGLGANFDEGEIPLEAPPELRAQLAPVLEVGYIRSPQNTSYTVLGQLPYTTEYRRYKLPVGQFPYGVAFRVRQASPSSVNRIFDLAVEAQAAERSRA
jgi:hypothetical protein